jgi:hypothetical protein
MARATADEVRALLIKAGATDAEAGKVVTALESAGLSPPQMRSWLASPSRGYAVAVRTTRIGTVTADWKLVPLWAVEDGYADAVIAAAEAFAAATPEERLLARTLLCDLADVRRITLSGNFEDCTRLVDWMRDERLHDALHAVERGEIDPVQLRARGPLLP